MPLDIDYAVLWNAVCLRFPSKKYDIVSVQFVSPQEMVKFNTQYRKQKSSTNVLTFSYTDTSPHEHDIAVCTDVAEIEAKERGIALRDYVALLVVHAMLHAAGMDHEKTEEEDIKTRILEREILSECGFVPITLKDVY